MEFSVIFWRRKKNQIIEEYQRETVINNEKMQEHIDDSFVRGYLFQCLKCGKYRLYTDCD